LEWRQNCALHPVRFKEACLASVPTLLCFDHQRNLRVERNPSLLRKDVNDLCIVGATAVEMELCILGLYYCLATLSAIEFCDYVENSRAKLFCYSLKAFPLHKLGFG